MMQQLRPVRPCLGAVLIAFAVGLVPSMLWTRSLSHRVAALVPLYRLLGAAGAGSTAFEVFSDLGEPISKRLVAPHSSGSRRIGKPAVTEWTYERGAYRLRIFLDADRVVTATTIESLDRHRR